MDTFLSVQLPPPCPQGGPSPNTTRERGENIYQETPLGKATQPQASDNKRFSSIDSATARLTRASMASLDDPSGSVVTSFVSGSKSSSNGGGHNNNNCSMVVENTYSERYRGDTVYDHATPTDANSSRKGEYDVVRETAETMYAVPHLEKQSRAALS